MTNEPLELLHIDLMRSSKTESLGGKCHMLVVVDDFSKYTWIELLREKSEVFNLVKSLYKRLRNEKFFAITRIWSDHGKEFKNLTLRTSAWKRKSSTSSLNRSFHNKMEWLRGRNSRFKKWLGPCFMVRD